MGTATARLGSAGLWARALTAYAKVPPPMVAKPPNGHAVKTPRAPAIPDPLQIEILGPAPVLRPQPGQGCDYGVVGSMAELREYLRPVLQDRVPFGADWETTSLNTFIAHPVGLSVSVTNTSARYVPVLSELTPHDTLPEGEVRALLQEIDALACPVTDPTQHGRDPACRCAFSLWYNVGYDVEVQYQRWHWEPAHWHDVQIAVFLVNSNVIELNLKTTALRMLGRKMQNFTDLDEEWVTLSKAQRKTRSPKMPHQLPIEVVAPYGCDDACCTRALWFNDQVQRAIKEQDRVFRLEEDLVPVMREGIRHGVYLDLEQLQILQKEAVGQLKSLKPEIYQLLGLDPDKPEFTLSQRAKLGDRLAALRAIGREFEGQWVVPKTDSGQVTTNKHVLDAHRHQHAVIPKLIQYNELEAQERNYIRKLMAAAKYFEGQAWAEKRCRFAFNAIGVPTGRMKCGGAGKGHEAYEKGMVDVNGQSLPDHEKAPYLPNTRSAIVAPAGFVIVAADYSQIELRLPANLANETVWIEAFNTGKDIHVTNAQLIANAREPGVIVTKADKMRRGKAKTTSFALLYGGDETTVARNAGISKEEGKLILDAFLGGLPKLRHWVKVTQDGARRSKLVKTFYGRIRHLEQFFQPEPSKRDFRKWKAWKKLDERGCREAINDPIQGGAADIFKIACVRLKEALDRTGWGRDIVSPQVYWVHDEVVFYVKRDWVTTVVPVLKEAMEFTITRADGTRWPVPLKAEFEVSSRLLYAEEKAEAAQTPEERHRWQQVAAGPEHHNYGELVALDSWLQRYGAMQRLRQEVLT